MKIKLKVSRAGAGISQRHGEIIDVDADEAKRLVDRNQAVYVNESPAIETATAEPVENAAKRTEAPKKKVRKKKGTKK